MRTPLAVLAAAAVAALGGAILGEYSLSALVALVAAGLFGVVVAEAVVVVERRPSRTGTAAAAAFSALAWVWAQWIATGHHLHYATVAQWAATVVAAGAAGAWAVTAPGRTTGP